MTAFWKTAGGWLHPWPSPHSVRLGSTWPDSEAWSQKYHPITFNQNVHKDALHLSSQEEATSEDADADEVDGADPEKEDKVLDATAQHSQPQPHLRKLLSSHSLKNDMTWKTMQNHYTFSMHFFSTENLASSCLINVVVQQTIIKLFQICCNYWVYSSAHAALDPQNWQPIRNHTFQKLINTKTGTAMRIHICQCCFILNSVC